MAGQEAGDPMAKQDLVIRIAGEAGEGILSSGQLLAQAAARAGLNIVTYFNPPAEIKGGHSFFQMRLSGGPLYNEGDSLDTLLAFNYEAYERNVGDLRPGGLVVFDSSEFTPPQLHGHRQVALPLTRIARTQLKFELAKNVVAVGAMAALLDLPTERIVGLLTERFERKGEEVLNKNLDALEAGFRHVRRHFPDWRDFVLQPRPSRADEIVVSGNQALALGALAAGVRFFAGYPITPASEIMEFLAENLPKVGGTVIQAEDELAAIGMVLGASYAGAKAMTATSGPGFSLMVEMLGLASMAELPCVVVDAQRAGPSTGMPTRHEQGDLYLAALGGHGEVPRIVLAPTSVEDCFYQAVNAFNLAERYQVPVIALTDTVLAVRTENIPRPNIAALRLDSRAVYQPDRQQGPYRRYDLSTPDGVSPMSLPGQPGGQYTATGLEHGDRGRPRYDSSTHTTMTEKRFRKLEAAARQAPEPLRYGDPEAEIGIVTWGSTTGAVVEAIDRARERGVSVELLAPRMLRPLPDHQIARFLESKTAILVPEVNYSGQLADLLAARYRRDLRRLNRYGGMAVRVRDVLEAIEEVRPGVADRPREGVRGNVG